MLPLLMTGMAASLPRAISDVPIGQKVAVSGQAASVLLASADSRKLVASLGPKKDDVRFFRYFHFLNQLTPAEMQRWRYHFNSLSDQGDFAEHIAKVSDNLLRVDVREFGWDRRLDVLEKFADQDVYFHAKAVLLKDANVEEVATVGKGSFAKRGNRKKAQRNEFRAVARKAGDRINVNGFGLPARELDQLRQLLVTDAPVISGDFFFSRTVRQIDLVNNENPGTGYYDFLGLKDRKAFFDLVGLDEKVAIAKLKEWRAVVNVSGVSQQNRQVVALNAVTGRVWVTLDTFNATGRGIARRNLRRGEMVHDVEEWYGFLPNGLPVTFLSDNKGIRQGAAPDKIGPDDSALRVGKDARIHVNLSCLRCHGPHNQLQPVDDWARKTFRKKEPVLGVNKDLQDPDFRVVLELRRQYLSDLNRVLRRDREDYTDAIERVTRLKEEPGLTSLQTTSSIGRAWNVYVETQVKVEEAARWWGTTPVRTKEAFLRWRKVRGGGDFVFDSYLEDPPSALTRLEFEDGYQFGAAIIAGLQPLEQVKKVRAQP